MDACLEEKHLIQGSPEWLAFRKTKLTATDAAVIMNASPWKTRLQLYHEKISETSNNFTNSRMQRGLDLEPIARELVSIKTGVDYFPRVVIKDWAMASMDGLSACGKFAVEIKCPGEADHKMALSGKIPGHYYPQLQHQMYVCELEKMIYFSFDGTDGAIVEIMRDDKYIATMIEEELKFRECLLSKTEPSLSEKDFVCREDDLWEQAANRYIELLLEKKNLEEKEEILRKELIFLSGECNTKGSGISLCKVQRKGNVQYDKIPELKSIDLEQYRKPTSESWRITCA